MNFRLLSVFLLLRAFALCTDIPKRELKLPAPYRIYQIDFGSQKRRIKRSNKEYWQIIVPLRTPNAKALAASLEQVVYTDENMGFGGTVSLQKGATTPCSIGWDTRYVNDIFKVDFGDGLERIFFTSGVPGNHGGSTMLYVFNPLRCEMISASTAGGGHHPFDRFRDYGPTHNYSAPGMADERKFLETVRYHYGYDDEKSVASSDDAWNAVRFWVIQNGRIDGIDVVIPDQGIIKVKRHSSPIMGPGISTSTLTGIGEDDRYLYQIYWHSYLLAKDRRTNEWFVLFVPPDQDAVVGVHSDGKLVRIDTAKGSSMPKDDRHVFEVSLTSFSYERKR